jgi:hypothetical protein
VAGARGRALPHPHQQPRLLEDAPTAKEKQGLRILVTGDSHLFVVDTRESFPNLLEAQLRAAGHAGCEVLSSGVGYTGPLLYLRRIEGFLELQPDAVVVSLFTGNDFMDELSFEYDLQKSPASRRSTPTTGSASARPRRSTAAGCTRA